MIKIKGKEFSEDTVVEALQKHCNFEEEKEPYYIFEAGDVVECNGCRRIILENFSGELVAFCVSNGAAVITGQECFEENYYKKIGALINFIDKGNQNE